MHKTDLLFSDADIRRIEAEGLTLMQANAQMDLIRRGTTPIVCNRPCTLDDGIITISSKERDRLVEAYDREVRGGRVIKFVPASGAASRMFADWYHVFEQGGFASADPDDQFFQDLNKYAFYDDLRTAVTEAGGQLDEFLKARNLKDILATLLTPPGMNYGALPKALLKFHQYPDGSRTALDEHLAEAALYVCDAQKVCRIHLTISEEHETIIKDYLNDILEVREKWFGVKFDIDLSIQSISTNTIALDMENRPLREPDGSLVFRPGGHGALLKNLNLIDGDVIMVKNIDNVVPDRIKDTTILYKKILGGYLIALRDETFRYLRLLSGCKITDAALREVADFCRERIYVSLPEGFHDLPVEDRMTLLFNRLNRPLRVCGMVKNEGEPGGGPFWVNNEDGTQSLQIVEAFQIDKQSERQKALWQSATHFNPVDLACGVRDFQGNKFDLTRFVNERAVCISQKSERGRDLKALERPGLWNGSMALWNTVFVEVPIETFNPVKTVEDLIRPQHLPA